jgi:hypothetical protein
MAFALLAGVIALTSMPVCGSAADVDPVACCEHYAHQGSVQPADHCARAAATRQLKGEICSAAGDLSNTDGSAAQCCNRGRLSYPQLKTQNSASVLAVLPIASLIPSSRCRNASAARQSLRKTPLKILPIALYDLTATYRI